MEKRTMLVEVEVTMERYPEGDELYEDEKAWICTWVDTSSLPSIDEIWTDSEVQE